MKRLLGFIWKKIMGHKVRTGAISNAYRLATILPIIFLSIVIMAVAALAITGNIGLAVLLIAVVGIVIAAAGLSSIQAALTALWGG